MSVYPVAWVWKHSQASGNDLLVLLAIADCANDEGENAYPKIDTVAAKTKLSRRTVQRAIQSLLELGELGVEEPASARKPVTYCLPAYQCQSDTPPARGVSTTTSRGVTGDAEGCQPRRATKEEPSVNHHQPIEPAASLGAKPLLAFWIDTVTDTTGVKPDKREIGEAAGIIRQVLEQGFPQRIVKIALYHHGLTGKTVKWLKSTCREVAAEQAEKKPRRTA